MFTVSAVFIATFKIGDNIHFNLKTLRLLYDACEEDWTRKPFLMKPIIITIVSIAEAMLCDFIGRIQSREWVSTLPRDTVKAIREKKYGDLSTLIAGAKKFDLFEASDPFYERLDDLRKLRNRVHIQNEKDHFERDEVQAFNEDRLLMAERALEFIAKTLSNSHPRGESTRGFLRPFEFPWHPHYEDV